MKPKEWRLKIQLENRQHNMLIHGFLMAIQDYVNCFGLESTAAYIIRTSGISKDDLIRCQLESNWQTEKMLPIIEIAFKII